MSRGTQIVIAIIASILIGVSCLFYLIRFHDGPMEIISGGPFITGEVADAPDDWSFLREHLTVELQTMMPPRSRTMWLVVVDNRLFVVSRYMNTFIGKIWKHWPRSLSKDRRAIMRVDESLYRLKLVRINEDELIPDIVERFNEKYRTDLTVEAIAEGNAWLFELTGR